MMTASERDRKEALERHIREMVNSDTNPLRQMKGSVFAALETFKATVEDSRWVRVFGRRVSIHGGCELKVDSARLDRLCEDVSHGGVSSARDELRLPIPMIINDPYFPPLQIVVTLEDLIRRCNRIKGEGHGPMHVRGRKRCAHSIEQAQPGCLSCVYKWWQLKQLDTSDEEITA